MNKLVPAEEWPQWREIYRRWPWDFEGQDYLHSRTAIRIMAANATLKDGITDTDLMCRDAFTAGMLADNDFQGLSTEEKNVYIEYADLTEEQYASLNPEQAQRYDGIQVEKGKLLFT